MRKLLPRFIFTLCLMLAVHADCRSWALLFGTTDCMDCNSLKQTWLNEHENADGEFPLLVFADVSVTANYKFFTEVEELLKPKTKSNTFPVLLYGKELLTSFTDDDALEQLLEQGPPLPPEAPIFNAVHALANNTPPETPIVEYTYEGSPATGTKKAEPQIHSRLNLLFFEQPGCKKCARQTREFQLLKERVPELSVTSFDVTTIEGQAMLSRARRAYGIPAGTDNLAPMVCWNGGYATGRLATADELAQAAAEHDDENALFWMAPLTKQEMTAEAGRLNQFLDALTWWSVISGGLTDGINPCAFATSIFLISYLLYLKRKRLHIIIVGGCFCIGVFITYFFYGIVLSYVLRFLQNIQWLKILIYSAVALGGFILCAMHLRDAFIFRKTGKASDMDMGLSKETHRGIHEKIRRFTAVHSWLLGPAAIVLGAVVSSMELACTGQVYFPILTALARNGINRQFLLWLLLYNVCFILPLAAITALSAYGVGAKALGDWAKRHIFATKIIMAALFAVLGALMLASLFA